MNQQPSSSRGDLGSSEVRVRLEEYVRRLEAFEHRGSATENERLAADYLAGQLDTLGVEARQAPFRSYNSYGLRLLIHVLLAAGGLGLQYFAMPALGLLVSGFVLVSLLAESTTRFQILSRLLPSSRSRNVVGRIAAGDGKPSRRLILCAHFDTQRSGLIWATMFVRPFSYIFGHIPGPIRSPLFSLTFMLLVQIAAGTFALFGMEWRLAYYIPLALYYLGAALLIGQWACGKFVPGACDNASGVAAALVLVARWLENRPADVELVILLTGSEEVGMLGAAAWLDANRKVLSALPTQFLNLDTLGYGAPHCISIGTTMSGPQYRYPAPLLRRCEQVADRLGISGVVGKSPPTPSDGVAFLSRGVSGLTLMTFNRQLYVPHLHQMSDRAEAMDFQVAALATELAWEVLRDLAHGSSQLGQA